MKKNFLKLIFLSFVVFALNSCSQDSDGPSPSPEDPKAGNQKRLGASAHDLLSADTYNSITLELGYVAGHKPTESAINRLLQMLTDRTNKPSGFSIIETEIPATDVGTFSIEEVRKIEEDNRTIYNTGDDLAVWVFFADQSSEEDSGNTAKLGTAYRNTSCVIYEKTIQDISEQFTGPSRATMEATTMLHEFGHLFGLVDLGSEMVNDHHDDENSGHCTEDDCLMYFQTVANIGSMVDLNSVPDFGEFCLQDLRANGGK